METEVRAEYTQPHFRCKECDQLWSRYTGGADSYFWHPEPDVLDAEERRKGPRKAAL